MGICGFISRLWNARRPEKREARRFGSVSGRGRSRSRSRIRPQHVVAFQCHPTLPLFLSPTAASMHRSHIMQKQRRLRVTIIKPEFTTSPESSLRVGGKFCTLGSKLGQSRVLCFPRAGNLRTAGSGAVSSSFGFCLLCDAAATMRKVRERTWYVDEDWAEIC